MGCDIHASVEVKRGNGQYEYWSHVADFDLGRNYVMFACMVRDHSRGPSFPYAVPARGLPDDGDISGDVRLYHGNREYGYAANDVCYADHTFSWLTPAEYRAACEMLESYEYQGERWTLPFDYDALRDYLNNLEQTSMDVRLVFGFDN